MGDNNNEKNSEYLFLKGAGNRWNDFIGVIKIMLEFIRGFRKLHFVGPCVTVFGSARFDENNNYYQDAQRLGSLIAQRGFTIMTGGGGGIMEAANRGAKDVDGRSVACNIVLPKEQQPNPYLDLMINMDHFYTRKVLLLKYSYAYVVMPGGFGTMDELFETLVLMQTNKIKHFPLVLYGKKYWTNILKQIDYMKKIETISDHDTDLFLLTDSVDDAVHYILQKLKSKYGTSVIHQGQNPRWWFFEKITRTINGHHKHEIKLD